LVANKRRGRPPKQALSADAKAQAVGEASTEVEVLPADTEKEYFFESKYEKDCFTLIKPSKTEHKDGSTTVNPGAVAQFDRHGWITRSAHHAGILRHIKEDRPETGLSESDSISDHHASMIRKATAMRRKRQLSEAAFA